MSFFSTNERALGLDISDKTLRLVQLKCVGSKIKIQYYNEVSLPANCIINGEIKQSPVFVEAFKKLAKTAVGHGALSQEIIAVLPETETFMKTLYVQVDNEADLETKIKEELPQHLPMDLEEIYFDWRIIKKENNVYTILVGASTKKVVDNLVSVIGESGFTPVVLEIEAAAISHLLIDHNKEEKTQIIIDIGANRTGLFLYDQGIIRFTVSLPISGRQIDQVIAESLDLDMIKAEQAKIICGLDQSKGHGAVLEILMPTINELTQQILAAINYYHDNFNDTKTIEKIVICGGGSNFSSITDVLKNKLNMEVIKSDPFKNLANPDKKLFTPEKSQSFITAVGLALRGLHPENFYDHP